MIGGDVSIGPMGATLINNDNSSEHMLLSAASEAGPEAVSAMFEQHRDKLRRMVGFRLDRRIQQRVDASDVLQEAFLEALNRLPEFLDNPQVSLFVWLRFLTHQKMLQIQQRHLGVQARDPRRELCLQKPLHHATSAAIVSQLIGRDDSPARAAVKAEMRHQLEQALSELDELDQEVLALRHFEQLRNSETAEILGLTEQAASKRYFRALGRLKKVMSNLE